MLNIDGRVLGVILGGMAGPALGSVCSAILGNPALVDVTSVGIVLGATLGATLGNLLVSTGHNGFLGS
jgi:hypothetical protein